ncbi:response regulator [Pokkaliibacter sp. CJK22405]|uniref:response regulator n=1 Tax=Pokkaliibacter sp. CJK22405 TaxID=3384615 RepID=UPI0039846CDF
MTHILIADDHPIFREAMVNVVTASLPEPSLSEAASLDETLTQLAENEPDLLLLDLHMPGMEGLQGVANIRNAYPFLPLIIISAEEERHFILQAISYGAMGYIPKSMPRLEMQQAITQVMSGRVFIPTSVIGSTSNHASQPKAPNLQELCLTRKQQQVLERMILGESNKQIATRLHIAETTVKAHVSAVLRKLGVQSRVQAILLLTENSKA